MRPLIPPHLAALMPYAPGRSIEQVQRELGLAEVIKLASNESPFGPSPRAVEAMAQALGQAHRYLPDAFELRAELGELHGVSPEQIVVGAGATDLIELCVRTFAGPGGRAVISACSFPAYDLFLRAVAAAVTAVPVRDFAIDLPAMAAAVGEDTALVFVPNPNNPTGSRFGTAALARFVASLPPDVVLVLDDAYVDYDDAADRPDSLAVMRARERTVVLRSFSKVHGLAGLRVGYAVTNAPLVDALRRVQRPFAVSRIALAGARAALDDREHVAGVIARNRDGRAWLGTALRELGLLVLPSAANFVTVVFGDEAEVTAVAGGLLRAGVIVRPLAAFGMPSGLRITVGTAAQNRRVVEALAAVLRERR